MTISLDAGTGGNNVSQSGVVSANMNSTTGQKLLVAIVQTTSSAAYRTVTSISNTAGCTWNLRARKQFTVTTPSTSFYNTEIWWAVTAGQITNDAVTALVNATADNIVITVMAWNGVLNLASPWDSSADFPVFGGQASGTATQINTPFGTIASVNGGEMIGAFIANASSASTPTGGNIRSNRYGSSPAQDFSVQAAVRPQGFTRMQWSGTVFETAYAVIGDVISADPPAGPTGTILTNLSKANVSAAGWTSVRGTIATSLTKASQSLVGKQNNTGTITTHLTKVSQVANGALNFFQGTITQNLRGLSQQALGWRNVTGTATTALRGIAQQATDIEEFIGTITTNLSGIAQSGVIATEVFTGTITTRLGRLAQDVEGYTRIEGTIVTRLGGEHSQLVANIVQAEEIIEGPIIMDLSGFRIQQGLLGLGALGAPGAGKYYSWRYTDS